MLKRMACLGNFIERREIAIVVYVQSDQFGIVPTHDPIESAAKNIGWNFHARPRGREIQLLQLLIKLKRPPIKVRMVFSLWPKIRELRLLFKDVIDRSAFDQPFVIERRYAFHAVVDFAG